MMASKDDRDYKQIARNICLTLPYTLIKQFLFYRFNKPQKKLPDFLCIGTQKSGTTWLYHQIKNNPSICLASQKEVHYFDWFFYRPLQWYTSRFKCSDKKICGEITPGYSVIEKGRIKFIKRIMPDVKLILLLRDPRERAWSSARYHFSKQNRDISEVTTEEYIRHFKTKWVIQRGDYESIWKKWSGVFPLNQILVLFTEDIENDPQTVLTRVYNFVGAEVIINNVSLHQQPNKSPKLDMPPEIKAFLDKYYGPTIVNVQSWLGIQNTYWHV